MQKADRLKIERMFLNCRGGETNVGKKRTRTNEKTKKETEMRIMKEMEGLNEVQKKKIYLLIKGMKGSR